MKPIVQLLAFVAVALLAVVAVYTFSLRTRPSVADQLSPKRPFLWPANVTLEAIEEIVVVLPGDIVADNETFDSVIHTSSPDTRIAFDPPDGSASFRTISLWLMPGVQLTLSKRAEVRFRSPDGKPGVGESFMKVVSAP